MSRRKRKNESPSFESYIEIIKLATAILLLIDSIIKLFS